MRQVQKSDRINSDRQSGSDQLGSTWIMKKNIKLNEIDTFTDLMVKIPVKSGPKERLLTFLCVAPCSQVAILYSKCQFLSDLYRVHPAASISTIMDPDEGEI